MNRSAIVLLFGWSAALLCMGVWSSDLLPQSKSSGNVGGNAFSHPGYVFAPCPAPAATPAPATSAPACSRQTQTACKAKPKACRPAATAPEDAKIQPCAATDTLVVDQS